MSSAFTGSRFRVAVLWFLLPVPLLLQGQSPTPAGVEIRVTTFSEKGGDVPVRMVFAGPTYHAVDVLSSKEWTGATVALRPDSTYLVKLRFGPSGRFATYGKVLELKTPSLAGDVKTSLSITRPALTLTRERITSDSSMTKEGKRFVVSFSSSSQVLSTESLQVVPSSLDEHGFQRQWKSQDGKVVLATYVSCDGKQITLRGFNGAAYQFDLEKLCEADRQYVAGIIAKR